jgi:hypothetical protein
MNELVRSSPIQQRHLHRPRYTLSSPYLGVLRADLRTTNRHYRHSHPGGCRTSANQQSPPRPLAPPLKQGSPYRSSYCPCSGAFSSTGSSPPSYHRSPSRSHLCQVIVANSKSCTTSVHKRTLLGANLPKITTPTRKHNTAKRLLSADHQLTLPLCVTSRHRCTRDRHPSIPLRLRLEGLCFSQRPECNVLVNHCGR